MHHPGPDNPNAAPTEEIVVLRLNRDGAPELKPMRWWLTPYWTKAPSSRYSMFNAKSETAHKSPAFREPLRRRRCLVPVCGFYEWVRQDNRKLPYYITPHADPGLLLAGLWDRWHDPESGTDLESFAILTAPAAPGMEFIHTRQPVMIASGDAARWLEPEGADFAELLGSEMPVALDAVPVSTWVNNARHKDARCLEPVGAAVPIEGSGA